MRLHHVLSGNPVDILKKETIKRVCLPHYPFSWLYDTVKLPLLRLLHVAEERISPLTNTFSVLGACTLH